MKNPLIVIFIFVIGLSGCATPVTPLPSTQTATLPTPTHTPTPIPPTQTPTLPPVCQSLKSQETPSDLSGREVVSEMVERLNAGDVIGAMSYFAEDARVYIIGVPPTGFEEIRGAEAICRIWANYVSDNLEWEITILSAHNSPDGVFITSKSKISLDYYRQYDAVPNEFFDNIVVEDGKIIEYSLTLKEESLAKLRSALSDVFQPSEFATDPSSATPGSEFNITFSDFTCTYDGPAVWKSGVLDINGEVKDDQVYALIFVHVDEGKDFFDLAVASGGHVPYWARFTAFDFGPGEMKTVQHTVGGTRMYLMCLEEKMTSTPIGLFGPFEVKP
jgi:ketosteroid isomerase-like protein